MTVSEAELAGPVYACTGTADPMVIRSGGLTLVFEHSTPDDDYLLTNWQYVGGPAAGFAEIMAPFGIRIGDARSELEAANPDFADYIDEIDVVRPFFLRYGVENDIVNWFGIIDCAFEMLVP